MFWVNDMDTSRPVTWQSRVSSPMMSTDLSVPLDHPALNVPLLYISNYTLT